MLADFKPRHPYREPAPEAADPCEAVTERAWIYIADFIYERPAELPSPSNGIVGTCIVERYGERHGQRQALHDNPSTLTWSTRERRSDMQIVNWILEQWARLAGPTWPHCRKVEIRRAW